jgi:hypothetical protein
MLARRLTQSGIEKFDGFLASLKENPTADAPLELLTDSATSEPIDADIEAEVRRFRSRLEIAEHLHRLLRMDTSTLRTDAGFWCWLSLYWFEPLCPVVKDRWNPGIAIAGWRIWKILARRAVIFSWDRFRSIGLIVMIRAARCRCLWTSCTAGTLSAFDRISTVAGHL